MTLLRFLVSDPCCLLLLACALILAVVKLAGLQGSQSASMKQPAESLEKPGVLISRSTEPPPKSSLGGMVRASIKGSKTIEFGKPDMGKMLLPMAPQVGLEMPGKIYIWLTFRTSQPHYLGIFFPACRGGRKARSGTSRSAECKPGVCINCT